MQFSQTLLSSANLVFFLGRHAGRFSFFRRPAWCRLVRRTCLPDQFTSRQIGVSLQNVSTWNWQLWCIDPSTAPLRPIYSHVSPAFPRWHPDDGCGLLYLTSSGHTARSSLYSWQAGVSGFWCHRLERHASPRRICAITRGLLSFSRSYQDTIIWFVCYYHHSLLLSGHLWSLQWLTLFRPR